MTDFWKHATPEQRLEQVKGAIELGLSGSQCALNCGAHVRTLNAFAARHGYSFPRDGSEAMRKQRESEVKLHALRKARAAKSGACLADDDSAYIFHSENNGNLFEPHPNDDGAFT